MDISLEKIPSLLHVMEVMLFIYLFFFYFFFLYFYFIFLFFYFFLLIFFFAFSLLPKSIEIILNGHVRKCLKLSAFYLTISM